MSKFLLNLQDALLTYLNATSTTLNDFDMSHERHLQDGKKKKDSLRSLKEKRADKKAKHEDIPHARKPRSHKKIVDNI
jgi:hypothetical protein